MSQQPLPPIGPARVGAVRDEEMEGMPARFGKYTLIRRLAKGGMAELFLALQKSVAGFEKLLVIKRILPSMNQDRAFIEMLLHEARIAATLSHPNIVQIFDVGQAEGQYFIAMEHVHGEDLRSIVRQMKKEGVLEFPLEHALAIVSGVCAGLAYAHDKRDLAGTHLGIVHRDISPQNIVVTFTGDVKIVDFGIAKSDTRGEGEQTRSGKLKGKVPYMSPEQARGESIDARSDLFATGTLLFELTTGKRLFKGQSEYETLKLICEREYPRPSEIRPGYPIELERIVMRALAKSRDDRYQSASEMQADLEAFVRRQQVAVSSLALNRFMRTLFEEKLAKQRQALLQGKHLADIIELEQAHEQAQSRDEGAGALVIHPSAPRAATSTASMPAAAHTVTGVRANRPGSQRTKTGAVLFALVVGAIGGAAYFWAQKRASTAQPNPTLAAPASMPSKGSLTLTSTPPGASIWINGDLRAESTPATLAALPTGTPLDVKLTLDGFEPTRQKLTLEPDSPSTIMVELKRGSVVVDVKLAPDGVMSPAFALDGKPVTGPHIEGVTSTEAHRLTVSAPGYAEASIAFHGEPLETKQLEVTLAKLPTHGSSALVRHHPSSAPATVAPGTLNLGALGGWCNVTVDGAPRGATPVAGVELHAGPHKVTCTTADGKTQTATVTVSAGETTRYKFTL